MELADLVAAVVVLGLGEIGVAALGLAPGRVDDGAVLGRSGPAVEPAHEVVLGREVRTAAEVEPDPRGDVHGWADVLALGNQHEPLLARDRRVQGEHGVVTVVVVVVRRRVGRRAGEDARVEERVDLVGLGLVEMVSECGGRLLRLRGEEVVESCLSCGVVVENAVAMLVVVVVVPGRVGSVNGFRSVVGREHDGGGVGPFVVQHFLSDGVRFLFLVV